MALQKMRSTSAASSRLLSSKLASCPARSSHWRLLSANTMICRHAPASDSHRCRKGQRTVGRRRPERTSVSQGAHRVEVAIDKDTDQLEDV